MCRQTDFHNRPPAAVDLLLTARYSHPVPGRWRWAGALQVLRAVSARRDCGELSGAGRADPRILLHHKLNDVKFGLALIHQPTRGLPRVDGTFGIVEGDACLVQCVDKTRVDTRVSMGWYRDAQCRNNAKHHQETSHRPIMAQRLTVVGHV